MDVKRRDTGVGMLTEAIGHAFTQVAGHIALAVERKAAVVGAVGAQVVDAAHMVVVAVGEQRTKQLRASGVKYLRIEVGTAVDEQVAPVVKFD